MQSAKDTILNEIFDQFATKQLNITVEYEHFNNSNISSL